MTTDDAPIRIGEALAAAVAGVLEARCPGRVTTHAPAVGDGEADPVADITLPVLVADGSDATVARSSSCRCPLSARWRPR